MGVFEFVIAIVGISTIGSIIREKQKAKLRKCQECEERSQHKDQQQPEKMDVLEERVQILEKIITDKGYNLSEEIKNL